jgi:catechol 2,3-dioxygenase-like lactoylglutathione lyase family enzyme
MRGLVHHLDLTVSDLHRSAPFYDTVLGFLGYRQVRRDATGIDWDLPAPYGFCSIGIKPDRTPRAHDRYTAGLHHLAWHAESRFDVDRLHLLLGERNIAILDPPAEYPAYGAGYYALFFADPDGLKFEFVHFLPPR